jgi:hypothetical protein
MPGSRRWYHWFFFGQAGRPAGRFISAGPEAWYSATAEHMGQEAYEDYRRAIHDPATVHAMMEDYRAELGIDREHDEVGPCRGPADRVFTAVPVGGPGRPRRPLP